MWDSFSHTLDEKTSRRRTKQRNKKAPTFRLALCELSDAYGSTVLTPGVLAPSVTSVAVIVLPVTVSKVTVKVAAPATSGASAGSVPVSVLVMLIVSDELTTRQTESQELTVTLNGTPGVCASGVPVLPVGVFGAAVSPGNNTRNWVNGRLIIRKKLLLGDAGIAA